jgi:hypothetical protein
MLFEGQNFLPFLLVRKSFKKQACSLLLPQKAAVGHVFAPALALPMLTRHGPAKAPLGL